MPARPLSGGPGRHQDSPEEVDHLPEGEDGVLPPRATRLPQQPEGRLHPAGPGLAWNHLLRHLPRPVVSGATLAELMEPSVLWAPLPRFCQHV